MDLEARILKVFKDVLEIRGDVDPSTLKYNETPNWASLAHITLVAALEGEFDIMLEPEDILAMSDFKEAIRIIRKATNAS
jgi:acyl carrier protein